MKTFRLLIDTCVWLDLAKDFRAQPVINALDDLVGRGAVELILPQVVLDEFNRNKARVLEEAKRSLQSHFRLVKEAVNRFGDEKTKGGTLTALNEVDHAIAMKSEAVNQSFDRIEKLLRSSPPLPTTDEIKLRVTDRALAKQAPYHLAKNSVGDAILIEFYHGLVSDSADEDEICAFVTHNINDFSQPKGDRRLPHADIEGLFDGSKSLYCTTIVDVVKAIDPEMLEEFQAEFNYTNESRSLSDLLEAHHLLDRQVWYNRHWNLRSAIEEGTHKVVAEADYSRNPYNHNQTLDTVWAGALAAAKRVEDEVGIDNLGPWDDFEWGMVNGKLSAIRWVLGDEWDQLDT